MKNSSLRAGLIGASLLVALAPSSVWSGNDAGASSGRVGAVDPAKGTIVVDQRELRLSPEAKSSLEKQIKASGWQLGKPMRAGVITQDGVVTSIDVEVERGGEWQPTRD